MARLPLSQPLEEPASSMEDRAEALRYTGVSSEDKDEFLMELLSPDLSKARLGSLASGYLPLPQCCKISGWVGAGCSSRLK